jgi:hypothetical protein
MFDSSDLQDTLEIVSIDGQVPRTRTGSDDKLVVLELLAVLEDDLVLVEFEGGDGGVCSKVDVEGGGGVLGGRSDGELLGVVHQGLERGIRERRRGTESSGWCES